MELLSWPLALFDSVCCLSSVFPGSSTWWQCSSCSECVSMQPGVELKPRVSVPVWAVTLKNHCPNLEVDPLLITGTIRRAQQVSHRREPSQAAHTKFCTFLSLAQPQPWSHRIRVVRLPNHSEHWLLQHWLLREGATRHALLEHDGAVVAASLHLP